MKKFVTPEIEVAKFMVEDVITVSTEEILYADETANTCTPIEW